MKSGSAVLCLALLLGCGSRDDAGPLAPVSVGGTIDGAAFVAKGSVAFRPAIDTCTHAGTTGPVLARVVAFHPSFDTAYWQSHTCDSKASSRGVQLHIWSFVGSGDIAPGTYPRRDDPGGGQVAFWWKLDCACYWIGGSLSAAGSVTIETNDATHIVGSLDVSFGGGDGLSGRFDAPVVASPLSVCEWFGWPGGTPGPGCSTGACIP